MTFISRQWRHDGSSTCISCFGVASKLACKLASSSYAFGKLIPVARLLAVASFFFTHWCKDQRGFCVTLTFQIVGMPPPPEHLHCRDPSLCYRLYLSRSVGREESSRYGDTDRRWLLVLSCQRRKRPRLRGTAPFFYRKTFVVNQHCLWCHAGMAPAPAFREDGNWRFFQGRFHVSNLCFFCWKPNPGWKQTGLHGTHS